MKRSSALATVLLAVLVAGVAAGPLGANTAQFEWNEEEGYLQTLVGSGSLATLYGDVERVALADESIARVQIISAREVLVTGLRPGRTTLFVWLTDGRRNRIQIEVERDLDLLGKALGDLSSGISVEVSSDGGTIVLLGDVADEKTAREAQARADAVLSGTGGGAQVLSLLRYPGSVSSIEESLAEILSDIDTRISVRRIQVGDEPDAEKDSFVLEGNVRTVQEMVKAVTLAERQLGGTGGSVKAADPERLNYERNRGFLGSIGSGIGRSGGATGVLTGGATPPKNSLSAQLARGLILTSETGRVISLLKVDELYQVMVSIRVLEVDRSKARQIGFNYRIDSEHVSIGNYTGPQGSGFQGITQPTIDSVNAGANIVGAFVDQTMSIIAAIDFLEGKALARAVAEPNILTLSGESASVVVGGEIPIPTSTVNQVAAVQGYFFQDFGVRLDIRPTVDEEGMIAVEASPSIARPSAGLGVGEIPGFVVQSVQTTARVKAGHSLVIGGLLSFQEGIEQRKMPGLGSVPVLGSLFRWKRRSREERELLFIITPRLVETGEQVSEPVVEQVDPAEIQLPELSWGEDRDGWTDDFEPQMLRSDGVPPEFLPDWIDESEVYEYEYLDPQPESEPAYEVDAVEDEDSAAGEAAAEPEEMFFEPDPAVGGSWVVQDWADPCLNLRPQPRLWAEPMDCLPPGTRVEEIDQDGAWLMVRLADGREGWMASAYLGQE